MQSHNKAELQTISHEIRNGLTVSSKLFDFHLILFILFIALPLVEPLFRYAKYCLPIIAVLSLAISLKFENTNGRPIALRKTLEYFHRWTIFYILLISYSFCLLAFTQDLFFRFFANSFFMLSPLLAVYVIFHYFDLTNIERYLKAIFWGLVSIFFLWKISVIPSLSIEVLIEALFTSQFPSENHLAFHFGLLVIYFFYSRSLRYLFGSAIMALLCFKRIVFPAIILSLIAYNIFEKMNFHLHKWRFAVIPLLAIVNLLAVYLSCQFAYGQYDLWLYSLTGRSPNEIFVGRQFIYSNVLTQTAGISWFGIGIGKIDELAFTLFHSPLNLHSDLLKNYLEFGVFLYVIWICVLYGFNLRSNSLVALVIYMNVLFLTDNTFIYFDVVYLFYLLSGILVYQLYALPPDKPIKNSFG
jgi:hypothetical protein